MKISTPIAALGSFLLVSACASPAAEPSSAVASMAEAIFEPDCTIYRLEHVDAVEAAQTLNELFEAAIPAQGTQSAHYTSTEVRFQANAETNSVLYWAPESQDSQIRALLGQMDQAFD